MALMMMMMISFSSLIWSVLTLNSFNSNETKTTWWIDRDYSIASLRSFDHCESVIWLKAHTLCLVCVYIEQNNLSRRDQKEMGQSVKWEIAVWCQLQVMWRFCAITVLFQLSLLQRMELTTSRNNGISICGRCLSL